jgi:hypothetical protein
MATPAVSGRTWLLLVLGMLMLLLLQLRPIDDVDLFWQIRLGELTLEQGHLITRDPFTYTHHGEPVPTFAWLAQVIFAALHHAGSWYAVQGLHVVLFTAAFLVAGTVRSQEAGPFTLACALGLAFLVAIPHSSVRPQSFAALGFAILLLLARSRLRPSLRVLIAVPVLVIWQNAHPSVVVGAAALLPLVVVEWVRFYFRRDWSQPLTLTALLLLTAAGQFATPMGPAILATTRTNSHIARDLLRISEWLPPWDSSVRGAVALYWVGLALSAGLLVRLRFRVEPEDFGVLLVMTLLSLYAARFGLFWALALIPVWARWIERARPPELFAWAGDRPVGWAGLAATLLLGLVSVVGLPPLLRPSILSDTLPLEGLRRLRARLPEGRIYNYREWGGPLILANAPSWQVAIDGRLYLFSDAEWHEYRAVAAGEVPVEEVVQRYGPQAFFLRPSFHEAFIRRLRQADWEEIYADTTCSVWVRLRPHDRHTTASNPSAGP